MEPESMAFLLGRESVREQPLHDLGRNADAIVDDVDLHSAACALANAHGDVLIGATGCIASVLGIALQINEDLKNFMFVDDDLRHGRELTNQVDAMTSEGAT